MNTTITDVRFMVAGATAAVLFNIETIIYGTEVIAAAEK